MLKVFWTSATNSTQHTANKKNAYPKKLFFSHQNTDSPFNSADVTVLLDSFTGKTVRVRVAKKADKLDENLLADTPEEQAKEKSLWESISR